MIPETLSLTERIQQAHDEVRTAPAVPNVAAEKFDMSQLRDAPDDEVIPFPGTWARWPGSFYILEGDEPQEIAQTLRAQRIYATVPKIVGALEHEREHDEFMQRAGATATLIGVDLEVYDSRRLDASVIIAGYFTLPCIPLSKLAYAGGLLYPQARGGPSYGDVERAATIGYPGGVPQVGKLIADHNQLQPAASIPLPLTYNPAERGRMHI